MDKVSQEEIISLLAKCGRPDLIAEFNELLSDNDFVEVSSDSSEEYDEDETEEEDMKITCDKKGFYSIID